MVARRLLVVSLPVALGACLGVEDEIASAGHTPPEASLRTPVIAAAGVTVLLDASASIDRDGDPLVYVFELDDGTAPQRTTEPVLAHLFTAPGLYTVRVRVVDPAGNESIAAQDVAVRTELPTPLNFCEKESDCIVGDECEAGMCFSTGGALE